MARAYWLEAQGLNASAAAPSADFREPLSPFAKRSVIDLGVGFQ